MPITYPIAVITVASKQAPLNSAEFDGNLTTLKDAVNDLATNKLNTSTYTATDVLNKIKTVDGANSGLDADLLDGYDSSVFIQKTDYKTKYFQQGTATITNTSTYPNSFINSGYPYVYVAFTNPLQDTNYAIDLDVQSASDMNRVGNVYVSSKATNGFNINMTGSATNVVIRWTLHCISFS